MIRFMILFFGLVFSQNTMAQSCAVDNRGCIRAMIESSAAGIENVAWRDQTYRELAKTKAFDGDMAGALRTLDSIENPDTKALTIRGIGMAVADLNKGDAESAEAFAQLRAKAEEIKHPPSYAIALTYIAMAQAFAGDNDGAWKTASEMENDALRHKAYGETAEVQAGKGNFTAAIKSIGLIDSAAYRNKAYAVTSSIFANAGDYAHALDMAVRIDNAYKKSSALQYVLDKQKPREVEK